MRPLRYSINVTLDGCCDHRAGVPDEDLHRHATANIEQADALLFGRVIYEMMEAAFRPPARPGRKAEWMEPFAQGSCIWERRIIGVTANGRSWGLRSG